MSTRASLNFWRAKRPPLRSIALRAAIAIACATFALTAPARAETLKNALDRAFASNPSLDAVRANLRGTQERLPQARAGYYPKVSAVGQTGDSALVGKSTSSSVLSTPYRAEPISLGLQVTQPLYDGGRTSAAIRQANAQIRGADQSLRNAEQTTIFSAAAAYMDVVRDRQLFDLQQSNFAFWNEQLSLVAQRHAFGDVTRVDVAQTRARLAAAEARRNAAKAALDGSGAVFEQIVGDKPTQLGAALPLDGMTPANLDAAMATALQNHPAILAARAAADAAAAQVGVVESDYLPKLGLVGSAGRQSDWLAHGQSQFAGSVYGQVTMPLYDGGETSARAREAKEAAGQKQREADAARAQVRAAVMTNWSLLQAAKMQIAVAQAEAGAAETAYSSIAEAYWFGQRTLSEVLSGQQELLNARAGLISARRDRVVVSFALAQAMGLLSKEKVDAELDKQPKASVAAEAAYRFKLVKPPASAPLALSLDLAAVCKGDCLDMAGVGNLRSGIDAPLAPSGLAEPDGPDPVGLRR